LTEICSTNSNWIENIISVLLEPTTALLTKDSSFEAIMLLTELTEEFAKAMLDCIHKENKIKISFSYSGAIQLNKDIEAFWDWIVRNNLQSTDSNAVKLLKSTSFSIINRNKAIVTKRNNRISPSVSLIRTNEITNSSSIQQNIRTNDRNCFSWFPCSQIFQIFT